MQKYHLMAATVSLYLHSRKRVDKRNADITAKEFEFKRVFKKAFPMEHFGRTVNVQKLLDDFPPHTSTLEKEKVGRVEMGMLMRVDNIDFADGGSIIFM